MRTAFSALLIGLVALLASCGNVSNHSADAPDHLSMSLVAVGGGGVSDEMRTRLVAFSPEEDPVVLIIPYASAEGKRAERGRRETAIFEELGIERTLVLDLDDVDQALADIEASDVIWMPGGSQRRMLRALEGAGVADAIRRKVRSGTPAGGTSAGAAIMSEVMIANADRDEETGALVPVISHGLGLWPEVIVDQHFTERERLERLVTAVEENPDRTGIGIDERTAVIVGGDTFEVMGEGSVTIVRASDTEADGSGTETFVLHEGDRYSLTPN